MQRMARSVLPTQKLLLAHHSHMKASYMYQPIISNLLLKQPKRPPRS
jgi:hypothetical protein